jgi:hypothetical protein
MYLMNGVVFTSLTIFIYFSQPLEWDRGVMQW